MMKMSYRLSRSKTVFADEGHVWLDCCTHKHMQMHTHTPDDYSCTCCSCLIVQDFYDLTSKLF